MNDLLYLTRTNEGSDMDSGRNLGRQKKGATKVLQYIGPQQKSDFGQLYAHNLALVGTRKSKTEAPNNYLNMEYETHLGTKIDYQFCQCSLLFQATETKLIQNQREKERTQILTKLMLAPENPCPASYALTGNRPKFLETDGGLAWFHHCPKVHSPLYTTNQCYDRLPFLYQGQIEFVVTITRQTYPAANYQNCSDRIKILFQLDMDQGDWWYWHTLGIVHQTKPAILWSDEVTPAAGNSPTRSQDAGLYTRSELRGCWDNNLVNAVSRTALKKFLQIPIFQSLPQEGSDRLHYYSPQIDIFPDKMMSLDYFKNSFKETFGPVVSVLEHSGRFFSVFLSLKFIIDIIVMFIRRMETNKMTGVSLRFG